MSAQAVPNVFLSWSGTRSHAMAIALRDWLPNVVRHAVPWMSSEDIAKGTVWSNEINTRLAECRVGIVVLTRENLHAPWVLFEAGAIFKAMRDRYVCTVLCGFEPPITGPLGQFQATVIREDDILRLCRDVDVALNGTGIVSERLEYWFKKFWPDLESTVATLLKRSDATPQKQDASDREVMAEILETIRAVNRQQTQLANLLSHIRSNPSLFEASPSRGPARSGDLHTGDRVRHPQYGMGTVKNCTPYMATILFDDIGEKRLMLEYARLELIERIASIGDTDATSDFS